MDGSGKQGGGLTHPFSTSEGYAPIADAQARARFCSNCACFWGGGMTLSLSVKSTGKHVASLPCSSALAPLLVGLSSSAFAQAVNLGNVAANSIVPDGRTATRVMAKDHRSQSQRTLTRSPRPRRSSERCCSGEALMDAVTGERAARRFENACHGE